MPNNLPAQTVSEYIGDVQSQLLELLLSKLEASQKYATITYVDEQKQSGSGSSAVKYAQRSDFSVDNTTTETVIAPRVGQVGNLTIPAGQAAGSTLRFRIAIMVTNFAETIDTMSVRIKNQDGTILTQTFIYDRPSPNDPAIMDIELMLGADRITGSSIGSYSIGPRAAYGEAEYNNAVENTFSVSLEWNAQEAMSTVKQINATLLSPA